MEISLTLQFSNFQKSFKKTRVLFYGQYLVMQFTGYMYNAKKIEHYINFKCILSKIHFPFNNSKYARFNFHSILGLRSLFLVINHKKLSWYTLTICVYIQKIENAKSYFTPVFGHNICTTTIHTKIKLNIFPADLWSDSSIGFQIKFIPHFLRLLCSCQRSVRPTPLLTETCSYQHCIDQMLF